MRNRIKSGRELPHVEKSYFHTYKFATDYPWFSSFLGWNPLLGAWPKQKWGIWQPDCKFTKNLYNMWFHFNIYRQQKEKGKTETKAVCQTHQNPTYQLQHHYGGPLRGASAGLATKLIISTFFLFHYIILIDKAIETVAQSWLSRPAVKAEPSAVPLHPRMWPNSPWMHIHINFDGLFRGQYVFLHCSRCTTHLQMGLQSNLFRFLSV